MKVTVIVREMGRLKPDYSLDFDIPAIPQIGSYISIQRPDKPAPYGEDVIVRRVWWRLKHPETGGFSDNSKIGGMDEILLECEVATSPYSSDDWLKLANGAKHQGINVEQFEVERIDLRQSDIG